MENHVYPVSYTISSMKTSEDTIVIYLIPHPPFPVSKDRSTVEGLSQRLLLDKRHEEGGTSSGVEKHALYFFQSRNAKTIKMRGKWVGISSDP